MTRRAAGGLFVTAVLLTQATIIHAQPPAAPSEHRFIDAINLATTGVEAVALLADGLTTQHNLKTYPGIVREADPFARPFVSRGWPGQIVGGLLVMSADVAVRHALHRKKHHRLERWVPLVLTVYGTIGALQNWRTMHRANRYVPGVSGLPRMIR